MKMFEKATREKLRFQHKGLLSVEDLWDLNVNELDTIYRSLNKQQKSVQEESLLETRSKSNTTLDLQIDIIKHIVTVKLNEKAEQESRKEKSEKKQKLMSILAQKQDADLQNKSAEELQKMLVELD
jgi:hypothetical protein